MVALTYKEHVELAIEDRY